MLQLVFLLAATSALGCDLNSVENLNVTFVSSSTVKVSWTAPSAQDVSCIQGYRICSTPYNGSIGCIDVQSVNISEYTLTDLGSCQQYNISVAALGENNSTSVPVPTFARTASKPVNNIRVTRKDKSTITVTWVYIFQAGRYCEQEFVWSLCDGKEDTATCTSNKTKVKTSSEYQMDLHKELDCKEYYINMVVLDDLQQKSDPLQFAGDPGVVSGPENLEVTNITSNSFDLAWTIPEPQMVCNYTVLVRYGYRSGYTQYNYVVNYDAGRTNHSAENITSCTACNVSVSFKSTGGEELSISTEVYTLPIGNSSLLNKASVQSENSSSITVAWVTTLENNQCVNAYGVCWNIQNTTGCDCKNASSYDSECQITGLEANRTYTVSITALLKDGEEFDRIVLDATTLNKTSSGAGELLYNSVMGFAAVLLCLLAQSML